MRLLALFTSLIFVFSSSTFAAEVTDPVGSLNPEDLASGSAGANVCKLRVVKSGYTIRRKPTASGAEKWQGVCGGVLSTSNISVVQPIGIHGNWIKFAHRSCPNGVGYVYSRAFNSYDLGIYKSGNCGVAMNYGPRNPGPEPTPPANNSTSVTPKAGNPHRFVLDRCQGIRNDRYGSGYYGASRGGGARRHAGCDYTASVGTPLKSPCSGRISVSTNAGAAGEMVQVTCNNGDKFKMMHLQSRTRLRLGTRVAAGTKVGAVGKTGNANVRSMVTHVHLEAIIRGRRVNPLGLWNCGR